MPSTTQPQTYCTCPAYPGGKSWDEVFGQTGSGKKFHRNVISGADFTADVRHVPRELEVLPREWESLNAKAELARMHRDGHCTDGFCSCGTGFHFRAQLASNTEFVRACGSCSSCMFSLRFPLSGYFVAWGRDVWLRNAPGNPLSFCLWGLWGRSAQDGSFEDRARNVLPIMTT